MYGDHTTNLGSAYTPERNRKIAAASRRWIAEYPDEEGILRQEADGEYALEGKLLTTEKKLLASGKEGGNLTITPFAVKANLNVKETVEEGSNITNIMTGFFDMRSDTSNRSAHYYIYNGTLSNYPEELTMILQE